jgi:YHS domain-containing protein
MKFLAFLFLLTLSVSISMVFGANAPSSAGKPGIPATKQLAWLEEARAEYPLKVCVVTGEDLVGDRGMNEAKDYIYKQAGKPDRLVRFCCGKCQAKFDKDPAKYLKLIDEAAAKATKH